MVKRKELEDPKWKSQFPDESSSSDDETDMLDVEFEWFDPQPEHDFHGLKTLLRQLFDVDAQLLDLSTLVNTILAQPLLGSTVKVEGNETDPYAFLTVLNLYEHKKNPAIVTLTNYIVQQAQTNTALYAISDLLRPSSSVEVGLILTERLLNIPSEVVSPMYKMLLEEIAWAVEEKEPYTFSHYLVLSKTYREIASVLDQEQSRPQKKKKKDASKEGDKEIFYFHPEDEVLQRFAAVHGAFDYAKQEVGGQADSKRTFQELGIKPQGHMILIEAPKLKAAVEALEGFLRSS